MSTQLLRCLPGKANPACRVCQWFGVTEGGRRELCRAKQLTRFARLRYLPTRLEASKSTCLSFAGEQISRIRLLRKVNHRRLATAHALNTLSQPERNARRSDRDAS